MLFLGFSQKIHIHNTNHTDANTLTHTQTQTPIQLHTQIHTHVAPRRVPSLKAHHNSGGNYQPRGRPQPTTCGEARVTRVDTFPTLITQAQHIDTSHTVTRTNTHPIGPEAGPFPQGTLSGGNCQPRGRPQPTTCGEARVTRPAHSSHKHNT